LASQSSIRTIESSLFLILRFIFIIIVFRQTELVNFGAQCRDGTGEGLDCCSFPVFLAIVVASSSVALSNMATLEALEP
jgi:hypothetical protein